MGHFIGVIPVEGMSEKEVAEANLATLSRYCNLTGMVDQPATQLAPFIFLGWLDADKQRDLVGLCKHLQGMNFPILVGFRPAKEVDFDRKAMRVAHLRTKEECPYVVWHFVNEDKSRYELNVDTRHQDFYNKLAQAGYLTVKGNEGERQARDHPKSIGQLLRTNRGCMEFEKINFTKN